MRTIVFVFWLLIVAGCDPAKPRAERAALRTESARLDAGHSETMQIELPTSRCVQRESLERYCESHRDSLLNCQNTWGSQINAARSLCGPTGEYSGAIVQVFSECGSYHQVDVSGADHGETWYYDTGNLQLVGVFVAGRGPWTCYGQAPERDAECKPISVCRVRGKPK
jgi:hypothetical protein